MLCLGLWLTGAFPSLAGPDLPAGTPPAAADPGEEDLCRTLDYLTEIATRTRLNADDTPGMVTVLYGDDLENRGIRTVAEAVSLVPGMRLALAGENVWRMVIRGVPRAFSSGQVKILLDGTPLTTAFGVDPVPNMPIEQVDRIEVMRGPVSVIHGEFADAGVLNIITRKEGRRVFGGVGHHGVYTAGGAVGADNETGDVRFSLNAAGQKADGAALIAAPGLSSAMVDESEDSPDALASESLAPLARSPGGSSDEDKTYGSGIASLRAGALDVQAHGFSNRQNDFYDSRLEGISARHFFDPSDTVRVNWGLGWQVNRFRSDSDFYAAFDPAAASESCLYGYDYDQNEFRGQASVTADMLESQTLLLQGDFIRTNLDDVTAGEGADEIRYGDAQRRLTSLTLQDEIRVAKPVTLTAGLRYDHYNDIGDYTTPRLAAVWRLDPGGPPGPSHVLKAQVARSYRPAGFMDMTLAGAYGYDWDDELTGRADTLELGYICRSGPRLGRVTLYHSLIDPGRGVDALAEDDDIRSSGVEAEVEFPLIPEKLTFDGNISLNTLENDSDRVNDWMTNLILTARPWRPLALSLLYRFEDPHRFLPGTCVTGDAAMDEIHRLDLTATLTLAWLRGVTLRAGVKNLTGEDIRYPGYGDVFAYRSDEPGGIGLPPGEQRLSRWWWTGLSFEF